MVVLEAIFVIFLPLVCHCGRFIFSPRNRVSIQDNWEGSKFPCKGDNIRFDDSQPVIAYMDHPLEAETMTLPMNGVLVFSDNGYEMGGVSNWQCTKQGNPTDTFFAPVNKFAPFHNPANWIMDDESFLNMNQVPSDQDDVHIVEPVSIYLDRPISVNTFQWNNRKKMTTDDFNLLRRTIEGQFQIQVSPKYSRENDLGGVQRDIADDIITVKNKQSENGGSKEGYVNPNSKNETLKQICEYVRCEELNQDLECMEPFVPFGHCCKVCGAKLELATHKFNLLAARERVEKSLLELDMLQHNYYSMERTSEDELTPTYEIVIARKENDSSSFKQDIYEAAVKKVKVDLAYSSVNENGKSILQISTFFSKTDRSVRTSSKIVAYCIYSVVLIAIVAGYIWKTYSHRLPRISNFAPVVTWKRLKEDVDLVEGGVETEEVHLMLSESEDGKNPESDKPAPTGSSDSANSEKSEPENLKSTKLPDPSEGSTQDIPLIEL